MLFFVWGTRSEPRWSFAQETFVSSLYWRWPNVKPHCSRRPISACTAPLCLRCKCHLRIISPARGWTCWGLCKPTISVGSCRNTSQPGWRMYRNAQMFTVKGSKINILCFVVKIWLFHHDLTIKHNILIFGSCKPQHIVFPCTPYHNLLWFSMPEYQYIVFCG